MDERDRLKEVRTGRGLSRRELADLSGVAEITISQYENKKRSPKAKQLSKLASALGVTVEWLMTGKEDIYERVEIGSSIGGSVRGTTDKAIIASAKAAVAADMDKLNHTGAQEAAKRVNELTRMDEYKK